VASHDSTIVITGGKGVHDEACVIGMWDLRKQSQTVKTFKAHTNTVQYCGFTSPSTIISGGSDGTVKLWDVDSGKCLQSLTMPGPVLNMAQSADHCFACGADSHFETITSDTTTNHRIEIIGELASKFSD